MFHKVNRVLEGRTLAAFSIVLNDLPFTSSHPGFHLDQPSVFQVESHILPLSSCEFPNIHGILSPDAVVHNLDIGQSGLGQDASDLVNHVEPPFRIIFQRDVFDSLKTIHRRCDGVTSSEVEPINCFQT